jgi:lipid II:glycine glycyltransferase (peptidoglycan interpeptide bridge formation enzyme)
VFIKEINSIHDSAYSDLASRAGSVFNSPAWLAMYGNKLQLFGIYSGDDELAGAFFLYRDNKAGFSLFGNPPFTPHIGWIFENRSQNHARALSENKKVMEAMAGLMQGLPVGVIRCAFPYTASDMQPFTWRKFKVVPNYTYRLPLVLPVEELEKRMATETRNRLRKAVKEGLSVAKITDYNVVKMLVLKTFNRKNKAIDKDLLEKILCGFADASNSFAFAAMNNGQAVSATFTIYDKSTAYYLLGGYDPAAKREGGGNLCMWQSILHSRELGLETFDFEGSMLPEVERYFRGFGADLVPYFTVNKAWLPLEFMLKLFKREKF